MCVCVFVCVCVRERERERVRESKINPRQTHSMELIKHTARSPESHLEMCLQFSNVGIFFAFLVGRG